MKKPRKSTLPTGGWSCLSQGEGPPRGNSRDFFLGVLGRDGKSNERHRKKDRSFDDRKKTWGKQPNFFIKMNGKRGFKCLRLWGRSCRAVGWADTLVGLVGQTRVGQTRFDAFWSGVWTLDFSFFWFASWDVMGNPMNSTEKKKKNKQIEHDRTKRKTYRINK